MLHLIFSLIHIVCLAISNLCKVYTLTKAIRRYLALRAQTRRLQAAADAEQAVSADVDPEQAVSADVDPEQTASNNSDLEQVISDGSDPEQAISNGSDLKQAVSIADDLPIGRISQKQATTTISTSDFKSDPYFPPDVDENTPLLSCKA